MKFGKLTIENFLAISSAEVNLADRGLVGIQGVNHLDSSASSNGSGKSSIADALCWCWFGVTARGSSGDEVINDEAGKNCRVVSVLEDGHLTYTATRHRKHKTGKNTFTLTVHDGLTETDLTKGTDKLTQEVAGQILGCSLDVFVGSIYAGQEKMPDLPSMTDKQLKVLIEEAAGVTVLEGAYQKARENANEAAKKVVTLEASVQSISDKIAWVDGQIEDQKKAAAAWKKNQADEIDRKKAEAAAVVPVLKKYQEDIAAMQALKLEHQITAVDARIAAVKSENDELARLERELADAASQLALKQKALSDAVHRQGVYKAEVATVEHKIGCPCGECGRPLTEKELEGVKKAATDKLDTQTKEVGRIDAEVKEALDRVTRAEKARNDFKATMTDISAATAERARLGSELANYNELLRQQAASVAQAKALRDKIAELSAAANPHEATIVKLTEERDKLKVQLDGEEKKLKAARDEVELENAVVKVFGPAGVRTRILDEVTPFLNAQTSKYLSTLSDGNIDATWTTLTKNSKGDLKEKFSIDVSNATGGKIFKALSGGEKRKVRIAAALALQDLVATRATKPIDLFIGDEIDDALDPAGLERLTVILEEKARERGSVFVISHNELRDHIKQVLLVEKMPDKTTKVTETVL